MESIVIIVAVGIVLWKLRGAFYKQAEAFEQKVDLAVKDNQAEMQEDYDELLKKIAEIKSRQNGKWYSMSDIDNEMKSDNTK